MPFFSIVVPVYNTAQYLPRAVLTLQNQSWTDWEAVLVDDGSPDQAGSVIRAYADRDSRIVPVLKERNEGTHRARLSGVRAARGQWILFLDADDELADDALELLAQALAESPCDVLHFGTELFGENMPEAVVREVAMLSNVHLSVLRGREIVESSFLRADGARQDWRVLQRVYRAPLVREAFERGTDCRLGRGEDAYEWLVIASLAGTERFRNDIVGYRYYLGRGITTFATMSAGQFRELSNQYQELLTAAAQWADSFEKFSLAPCVAQLRVRIIEMLAGDWAERVESADKKSMAQYMAQLFGAETVAAELMRLVRDSAYAQWDTGREFDSEAEYLLWYRWAVDFAHGHTPSERLCTFQASAQQHITDLARRSGVSQRALEFKPHLSTSSPGWFVGIWQAMKRIVTRRRQ
ncbi:MAG: glycosyltransferase [Arcanobacterium sp.]|nr:glycosyltransferase [Arcanobacterium sp.]